MATLTIGGKTLATQTGTGEPVLGSNVILSNDSLVGATFPAGHIIQVESASFNGIQTLANANEVDVSNLSCSMTISSGNKILIIANVICGRDQDSYGTLNITDGSNNIIYQNFTASGTQVNASMAVANRGSLSGDVYFTDQHSFNYLWTPGYTNITVKVRGRSTYSGNIYVNKPANDGVNSWHIRTTSSLTIMEIQS